MWIGEHNAPHFNGIIVYVYYLLGFWVYMQLTNSHNIKKHIYYICIGRKNLVDRFSFCDSTQPG